MNITHKLLIALTYAIVGIASSQAQNKTNIDRDSVILAYRPNSSVLMVDYKNNASQLQNIFSFVKKRLTDVQQNKSHINIVSYIKSFEVGNANAINLASIQASVVRAEFKTRYDIPHSCITFSIDTTQNTNNLVRVDYVAAPVPVYSNNAIFYTESQNLQAKQMQMMKYKPGIPYTNYWMHLAKLDPEMFDGAVFAGGVITIGGGQIESNIKTEVTSQSKPQSADTGKEVGSFVATTTVITTAKTTKDQAQKTDQQYSLYGQSRQVFGLKTNLLYWAVALPNLEFEFYMGKQFSLNLEGAYTWGWFLPSDKAYFGWNAGGELRYWFDNSGDFKGHFLGVYGNAGQYDYKFSKDGNQGDYYGAGLSYGYVLPIKKRFHMEFAIGAGWANYSHLKYLHVDGYNFETEFTPSKNYFGITKAKVSCVWRF